MGFKLDTIVFRLDKVKLPGFKKFKNFIAMSVMSIHYYKFSKELQKSRKLAKNYFNRHKGERCFILATGPSLNYSNLSLLKGENLFGMNILYKKIANLQSMPEYWGVLDSRIFIANIDELTKLNTTFFLGGSAGRYYLKNIRHLKEKFINEPIVLKPSKDMCVWNYFSRDITKGIAGAGSVTIDVCLQVAYYLGFKEVYLIGVDADFSGKHFDNSKPAFMHPDMDKQKRFNAYEICKEIYEKDGRKIYNATIGGKLEVFERVKLEDIKGVNAI